MSTLHISASSLWTQHFKHCRIAQRCLHYPPQPSAIKMTDAIWSYIIKTRLNPRHRFQQGVLATAPLNYNESRVKSASRLIAAPSGDRINQVEDRRGDKFIVTTCEAEADCDCGKFGEYQAACTHAIIAVAARECGPSAVNLYWLQHQNLPCDVSRVALFSQHQGPEARRRYLATEVYRAEKKTTE